MKKIVIAVLALIMAFAFTYNKSYIKDLLEKGFMPQDDFSKNALKEKGFVFAE